MRSRTSGSSPSPNPDQENVGQKSNASGENHKNRTVSRRTLLGVGAAAGTVALSLIACDAPSVSAAVDGGDEAIPGIIERIVLPNTIYARNSNGSVMIKMEDTARFRRCRAGIDVRLADYMIGDEIVAEGHWSGRVFIAHALASSYRLITGRITGRDGSAIHTTQGTVYLTSDTTLDQASTDGNAILSKLANGDDVRISAWHDPSNNNLVALVIARGGQE